MRTCKELGVCQARHCIDCPMPRVRVLARTATEWDLPIQVRGMLRSLGLECAPGQKTSQRHVGCDRQIQGGPWPGADFGVRPPMLDETPISFDEAVVGLREGLLCELS